MRRMLLGSLATAALISTGMTSPAAASRAIDGSSGSSSNSPAASPQRVMQGTDMWRDPETLTPKQAAAMESQTRRVLARSAISPDARPSGSVSVPIDFHGITDSRGHGFVSKARIHAQINVLNQAFGGRTSPHAADTPFRFRLNSISRTKSDRWYNANALTRKGFKRLKEMQRTLHVGDARHLNMYTVGPKFRLLGYAFFPTVAVDRPKLDGVVLFNASLPRGNADYGPGSVYNRGDTGTHEVGHWLNLYHTFQSGCGRLNDYVTDTERQKAGPNIFEEDPTLNTCRPYTARSRDPVRNFMGYVDDPYMNQFTRGQRDRMNTAWYIREALS